MPSISRRARALAAATISPPAGSHKLLELFAPHADLLHGQDGGLYKTGTMSGVRTLAGYADTKSPGECAS